MGLIGIRGRAEITPQQRRKSFLKHVQELGYHDGYYSGEPVRILSYQDDDEARARYRVGVRIGKRERGRDDLVA